MERVPGGMMIVPLLLGALLTTAAPHTAEFFGSFTGALITGSLPLLAAFYICIGSTISVRSLPGMLRRGGVLMGTRVAVGILAGVVVGHWLGMRPVHGGLLAGVSTLAVVAALNDTNGGLYMALMGQYGRPEDAGAYSVMALESGPFFTMVTLGAAGLSSFPWHVLLGAVLPLAVGITLGNLDPDLRSLFGRAAPALIPFFAFALGATLDLRRVWQAGVTGVLLGIAVILVCGPILISMDRLTGGTGTAGMAASATAGNAAAVPMLVATADRRYAEAAGPATVLVASSVIVTAFLVPPLTAWWHRRTRAQIPDPVGDSEANPPAKLLADDPECH